jgi:asparagine N-glycosylation enzyme membrane subunit Stt3
MPDGGQARRALAGKHYARIAGTRRLESTMAFARLLLPMLACLLLAAHFYRAGWLPLAVVSVLLPLLLAVPRAWAARAMQLALAIGAIEWLRTLAEFTAVRISMGQPYGRLVAILLAVALFTAASALVFRSARLRARYRLG